MIVLTPADAQYYADVCDDYRTGNNDTGLSQNAACEWAIYGFTVQGEIAQEENLHRMADYIERLRDYTRVLRDMITELYQASQ